MVHKLNRDVTHTRHGCLGSHMGSELWIPSTNCTQALEDWTKDPRHTEQTNQLCKLNPSPFMPNKLWSFEMQRMIRTRSWPKVPVTWLTAPVGLWHIWLNFGPSGQPLSGSHTAEPAQEKEHLEVPETDFNMVRLTAETSGTQRWSGPDWTKINVTLKVVKPRVEY